MKKIAPLLLMILLSTFAYSQAKYNRIINSAEKVLKESLNDPFSYVRTTAEVFDSVMNYDFVYNKYVDSLKMITDSIRGKYKNDTRAGLLTSLRINESYQKTETYPKEKLLSAHESLLQGIQSIPKDSIAIYNKYVQLNKALPLEMNLGKNKGVYCYLINFKYRAKNSFGGYVKGETEMLYYPKKNLYEEPDDHFTAIYSKVILNFKFTKEYRSKKLKMPSF